MADLANRGKEARAIVYGAPIPDDLRQEILQAYRTLQDEYGHELRTATGLELMPGVVAVIQTFGSRINFHPHIHVLMTEGGTALDGAFHHVGRFHDEVIQEIFTHEVFSMLLRKKLIGLPLVQKILHWRHTGFNVHSKVRAESKSDAERVGEYMIRPMCLPKAGSR